MLDRLCVREGVCSCAYILKGFHIFLFSRVFCDGKVMMDNFS